MFISMIISRNYLVPKANLVASVVSNSLPRFIPPSDHAFVSKAEMSGGLVDDGAKFDGVFVTPPFFQHLHKTMLMAPYIEVSVPSGNKKLIL